MHPIVTIVAGLLAASSWVLARHPQARDVYARVEPYREALGVVVLLWGLFVLVFRYILALPVFLNSPLDMLLYTVTVFADLGIGFLLGYPLLSRWLLRGKPVAEEKAQRLRAALRPYQIGIGLTAVVSGVLLLFSWVI